MRLSALVCLVLLQQAVICHAQEADPADVEQLFQRFHSVMMSRPAPLKRAVFLKPHVCAQATFTVVPHLKAPLNRGVFAVAKSRRAWVRFSSDTAPGTSDFQNSTIGMGIKVLDVVGEPSPVPGTNESTQDFLVQNHHVFFSATAKDFMEFIESVFTGTEEEYLRDHPDTDRILKDMDKVVDNVLNVTYGSGTPYHLGALDYVKYKVKPCVKRPFEAPPRDTQKVNYLRTRAERDLMPAAGGVGSLQGACFEFQVQLRVGDMPVDNATLEWSEAVSAPVTVARIEIAKQDVKANDSACENMAFNPGRGLNSHRPAGSINHARALIYKRMSDIRRGHNGKPVTEPRE